MRCEDVCDFDDEDFVNCDKDGSVLESLDVKSRWWRATRESLKVYECPLDRSCRGGNSTTESEQCFGGHVGALCAACDDDYDYNIGSNRCVGCTGARKMLTRAGNLGIILVLAIMLCSLLYARYGHHIAEHSKVLWLVLAENAKDGVAPETEFGILEEAHVVITDEEKNEDEAKRPDLTTRASPTDDTQEMELRRKLDARKKVLTKLKIVLAALQISPSTDAVRLSPDHLVQRRLILPAPANTGPRTSSLSKGFCETDANFQRAWSRIFRSWELQLSLRMEFSPRVEINQTLLPKPV